MRRLRVAAGVIVVGVMVLAGCSSQEEPSVVPAGDGSAAETGVPGSEGGSAVLTLEGTTYELGDNRGCTIGNGAVIATFEDGDDLMSMTSSEADGVVLIRMTVGGVMWSHSGRELPEVSGNSANWSGDVSPTDQGQIQEPATINITC